MTDALDPIVTDEILEDCLQAVQRSADQGRAPTVEDVTAFARIPASTTEAALRELRSRGLLDGVSDGLVLSDEGRRQAAAVIRRHRLSERLLTDVLGLPWDRVHDQAMRLEHSLTPEAEADWMKLTALQTRIDRKYVVDPAVAAARTRRARRATSNGCPATRCSLW